MIHNRKFWRAETLIEVVVALGIVAAGATTAANLSIIAMEANQFNKDQLIAQNLVQEGLETVRAIRDGNLIKFATDKTNCWNMNSSVYTCADDGILLPGEYYFAGGMITNVGTPLDLKDGVNFDDSNYKLKIFDLGRTRLLLGGPAGWFYVKDSPYYLDINIQYKKSDTAGNLSDPVQANYKDANVMIVTAKVQWDDRGRIREVKQSTTLSNYKQWK